MWTSLRQARRTHRSGGNFSARSREILIRAAIDRAGAAIARHRSRVAWTPSTKISEHVMKSLLSILYLVAVAGTLTAMAPSPALAETLDERLLRQRAGQSKTYHGRDVGVARERHEPEHPRPWGPDGGSRRRPDRRGRDVAGPSAGGRRSQRGAAGLLRNGQKVRNVSAPPPGGRMNLWDPTVVDRRHRRRRRPPKHAPVYKTHLPPFGYWVHRWWPCHLRFSFGNQGQATFLGCVSKVVEI